MKDVGGWISARQGCGKSFNPNKSRWNIRRKMRLRWRSSTSGPSKGKGAPQISRRMTRLRVALGDHSCYLQFVLENCKFSHDLINSQNYQQIFNRIDMLWMFVRLLYSSSNSCVCHHCKRNLSLLLWKKILKYSDQRYFLRILIFTLDYTRHHFSLSYLINRNN